MAAAGLLGLDLVSLRGRRTWVTTREADPDSGGSDCAYDLQGLPVGGRPDHSLQWVNNGDGPREIGGHVYMMSAQGGGNPRSRYSKEAL